MKFVILKNVRVILGNYPVNLKKGESVTIELQKDIDNFLRLKYVEEADYAFENKIEKGKESIKNILKIKKKK